MTEDAFIAGRPARYSGLEGRVYTAWFIRGRDVSSVLITLDGRRVRQPIMMEHEARSFFRNLPVADAGSVRDTPPSKP